MKTHVTIGLFLLLLGSGVMQGCKKKGCTDPKATNYDKEAEKDDGSCKYDSATVTFLFDHAVGDNSLEFDKQQYTNKAGNEYDVQTLKYYVSDIVLHRSDGENPQIDTVHYRDGRKSETRKFGPYPLPNGTYNKITFIFGLDQEENESGYLPNTQTHNNMIWPKPMGGGYHYIKLEGAYIDSSGSEANYKMHVGELNIDDTTQEQTIPKVTLNLSSKIKADYNDWKVTISMDINEWYQNPHTYDFNEFGQEIMGDPEAQQLLKENVMRAFQVKQVSK